MTQPTKHKHADLIIQWALGAEVQIKSPEIDTWYSCNTPYWESSYEYRIKPAPKPDVVVYANMEESLDVSHSFQYGTTLCGCFSANLQETDNIKVTYSGETGKLKSIEMIDQE